MRPEFELIFQFQGQRSFFNHSSLLFFKEVSPSLPLSLSRMISSEGLSSFYGHESDCCCFSDRQYCVVLVSCESKMLIYRQWLVNQPRFSDARRACFVGRKSSLGMRLCLILFCLFKYLGNHNSKNSRIYLNLRKFWNSVKHDIFFEKHDNCLTKIHLYFLSVP